MRLTEWRRLGFPKKTRMRSLNEVLTAIKNTSNSDQDSKPSSNLTSGSLNLSFGSPSKNTSAAASDASIHKIHLSDLLLELSTITYSMVFDNAVTWIIL
jgi:hypothetical protein